MMDAEPAQIPFRESEVESLVAEHLITSGYEVSRQSRVASGIIDLVAVKDGRSLVVEVKGEDAGGYTSAQMNFLMAIGQIASRMTEAF
jgi:Holliday junction resolvase-like predicted endonuclease